MKNFWGTKGYKKILNAILAVVFGPVLFCVVFIGNGMNYNQGLKLPVLCPGILLSLAAAVIGIAAIFLLCICRKYEIDQKKGILTTGILTVFTCGVYFLSFRIAREIAFKVGWDVGVVRAEAREIALYISKGYDVYFSIYTNNLPISYVLGKLFRHAIDSEKYYITPEVLWIQVNCALMAAGILFACLIIKRLTRNIMAVIITFCAGLVLIGFSGWIMVPYTDTYGQVFPIASLYFYLLYRQESAKKIRKILYLVFAMLLCGMGGFLKPNLYVVLIAFGLMETVTFLADIKGGWKYYVLFVALGAVLLVSSQWCKNYIVEDIGLERNKSLEAGPADYFYMGLNEEKTGSYNSDDAAIFGEFQSATRWERQVAAFGRGLDRMAQKGVAGTLYFWLRKMVMTFNDGTFGFKGGEVWLAEYYDPVIESQTDFTGKLRSVYWAETANEYKYNTVVQIIWIFCLLGVPGMCLEIQGQEEEAIVKIIFLGIFFYQMFFEARARYLFAFLPVILVFCVMGYMRYAVLWEKITKSGRGS